MSGPLYSGVVEIDRRLAILRRELVDDIAGYVGEQQIAALALLHPYRTFGETEAALDELDLGVRRDQRIERRIEPHDVAGGLGRRH